MVRLSEAAFFGSSFPAQLNTAMWLHRLNWIVKEDDANGYCQEWIWEGDGDRPGVYRGPACRLNVTEHEVRWPSAHVYLANSEPGVRWKRTKRNQFSFA